MAAILDTRIPPKLKTQIVQKQKIKTRHEDGDESFESSHVGVAVPVTMEELELENKEVSNESSTTNEGISTWILLSNPANKDNTSVSTEPTKSEETQKKQRPAASKNKVKKPQNKLSTAKRPIIGSTNKADLIAGGSAINENVYNKIKDTVLTNVQKNKNSPARTTTVSTTTSPPSTEALTTRTTVAIPIIKVTSKPAKKTNKNKVKVSTTTTAVVPVVTESAALQVEPKEQEIELEISTPATTTKKPKRSSNKKKTKTKKRKTTKPKKETTTAVATELKTTNKTKVNKTSKKPNTVTGPFTTQIYNYFSREVMPSVGVGVIGLAGLVGIASYFLYPFATPVRRTIEVDKKDDIYRHNAEEYASEGNGQPEEEMLGTVLAGMPVNSKQKFNPYAGQTAYINRYPAKKDQDIRYRHVANNYEPNRNVHFPQQKTGIAHGAVYPEPINYNHNHYQYETRHAYTTEKKYEKPQTYTPYPAVEPIYAAPQTGPSAISSYGSDASSSVVYGVKPSEDTDFKPVYPYETQFYSESTSSPVTYSPTSMYLGSNNEAEDTDDSKYSEENSEAGSADNKFVVGNVPKELTESATPVVVPEHGPRKLNRRRRNIRRKRNIVGSIEEILKAARENKENEIFISNEIDEGLGGPITPSPVEILQLKNEDTITPENKDVFTVYAVSMEPSKEQETDASTIKNEVIESISTLPIDDKKQNTETEMSNELDITTKSFKVYEVFPTTKIEDESSPLINEDGSKPSTVRNVNTETTTEVKSESTSTVPYVPNKPKPTYTPEVITYPPLTNGGIFDFIKRLVEFKYRLGLSILQSTSESLSRYLRNLDDKLVKNK